MEKSHTPRAHLFLAAAGGGIVALALAAAPGIAVPKAKAVGDEVVRAQRFEVVDPTGVVRGVLGVAPDRSVGLVLNDEQGKLKLRLWSQLDGSASLTLFSASEQPRASVAVLPDGTPGMGLFDAAGGGRSLGLTLPSERIAWSPRLSMTDASGKMRVQLMLFSDGTPVLAVHDARGEVVRDASTP